MKHIPLTKGKFAIVDDEDFEKLSRWSWCFDPKGYARRGTSRKINGVRRAFGFAMHRVILGLDSTDLREVDHINGERLDNRKANLRIVTGAQNSWNARKLKPALCKQKGVTIHRRTKAGPKYSARVMAYGVSHYLGCYSTPEEAAAVRSVAAKRLHGEFARDI